jgi:hypothetical protein
LPAMPGRAPHLQRLYDRTRAKGLAIIKIDDQGAGPTFPVGPTNVLIDSRTGKVICRSQAWNGKALAGLGVREREGKGDAPRETPQDEVSRILFTIFLPPLDTPSPVGE